MDTERKITILFTRRMSCYWRVLIPYFALKIKRNPKTFSPPFLYLFLCLIAFVHCPCSICRVNLSVIVLNMSVTRLFYCPVLQRVLYTNSSCYFFSTSAVHTTVKDWTQRYRDLVVYGMREFFFILVSFSNTFSISMSAIKDR